MELPSLEGQGQDRGTLKTLSFQSKTTILNLSEKANRPTAWIHMVRTEMAAVAARYGWVQLPLQDAELSSLTPGPRVLVVSQFPQIATTAIGNARMVLSTNVDVVTAALAMGTSAVAMACAAVIAAT